MHYAKSLKESDVLLVLINHIRKLSKRTYDLVDDRYYFLFLLSCRTTVLERCYKFYFNLNKCYSLKTQSRSNRFLY
jgi:hypothetical protein